MKWLHTYIRYLLAIYMASHFIFNGAFLHNHEIDGETITHAHPFTGTQHSSSDAQLILSFNNAPCLYQEAKHIQEFELSPSAEVNTIYSASENITVDQKRTSRAPPVLSMS